MLLIFSINLVKHKTDQHKSRSDSFMRWREYLASRGVKLNSINIYISIPKKISISPHVRLFCDEGVIVI